MAEMYVKGVQKTRGSLKLCSRKDPDQEKVKENSIR